jgi:phosphotransacetylase/acyl dehydratase
MDYIENRTFNEIQLGESASLSRTLTKDDILLFAAVSGDVNPAHVDEEFARSDIFHKVIAHGMWGAALISTVLGTLLPGPGTIYLSQTLRFKRPVAVGDTVTVTVTAQEKIQDKRRVVFACQCVNQAGEVVIEGAAEVMAPKEKIKRPRVVLPQVKLYDELAHYRELLRLTEGLEPIRMAVAHPVDKDTLLGVREAANAGLIIPVLVGPQAKIRTAAEAGAIDLAAYELIPTEHSHAAATQAVALARSGAVDALMKGTLPKEELLAALTAPDSGLQTAWRMSHVYALDVAGYPRALFLTDAALNVHPRLADKRDIVQNAIDLLQALGRDRPKVAILSALEQIDPSIESTLEAAALCKMAERGQITGGIVDGPLAFDTAVAKVDKEREGVISPIAGNADILVVPDLEAGQILVKQLEHLAGARAVGLVLGARAPIVFSDPSDTPRERTAACALALLMVQAKRQGGRRLTPALPLT